MAGVPPHEARSNISQWLDAVGLPPFDAVLTAATDQGVMWAGIVLVTVSLICAVMWACKPLQRKIQSFSGDAATIEFSVTAQPASGTASPPSIWMRLRNLVTRGRKPTRATTWITEAQALHTIRASSLVLLRLPHETITVFDALLRNAGLYHTRGDVLADELSRKFLRDFATELPQAVRNGDYGKEPLAWWIDKEADRHTAS